MNASNLPDDMKRSLLDQVRRQIGDSNYERMVSEIGEDRFLGLCLEKATTESEPARTGLLRRWGRRIAGMSWVIIPGVLLWLGGGEDSCLGMLGLIILWCAPLVGSWIGEWSDRLRRY